MAAVKLGVDAKAKIAALCRAEFDKQLEAKLAKLSPTCSDDDTVRVSVAIEVLVKAGDVAGA